MLCCCFWRKSRVSPDYDPVLNVQFKPDRYYGSRNYFQQRLIYRELAEKYVKPKRGGGYILNVSNVKPSDFTRQEFEQLGLLITDLQLGLYDPNARL